MINQTFTLELRISGFDLDRDSVGSQLFSGTRDLAPVRFRPRTDVRPAVWSYCSLQKGEHSDKEWKNLEEAFQNIFLDLELHRDKIKNLSKTFATCWWCGHFQRGFNCGMMLSPELISMLASFEIPLYLDSYFSNDDGTEA